MGTVLHRSVVVKQLRGQALLTRCLCQMWRSVVAVHAEGLIAPRATAIACVSTFASSMTRWHKRTVSRPLRLSRIKLRSGTNLQRRCRHLPEDSRHQGLIQSWKCLGTPLTRRERRQLSMGSVVDEPRTIAS